MDYRLPDGDTVTQRLLALQKSGNKPFTKSLHPGIENILGLRVPDVRALAKEIAGSNYLDYLARPGEFYMEERMLHGMVLGQIKITDTEEYLRMVNRFVGCINSWSVCDTFKFAGGKNFITRNSGRIKEFLTAYLSDNREYAVRFGIVMLMSYFITWRWHGPWPKPTSKHPTPSSHVLLPAPSPHKQSTKQSQKSTIPTASPPPGKPPPKPSAVNPDC